MTTNNNRTEDQDENRNDLPLPKGSQLEMDDSPLGWDPITEDVRIYPKGQVPKPVDPMVIDSDNPSDDEDDISDLGEYKWLEKWA